MTVNLLGSAAAGVLAGVVVHRQLDDTLVALLGAGFLAAFTTASTFAWEVVALAQSGHRWNAALIVLLSVGFGVAVALVGFRLGLAL